jgi:hypothetical protein
VSFLLCGACETTENGGPSLTSIFWYYYFATSHVRKKTKKTLSYNCPRTRRCEALHHALLEIYVETKASHIQQDERVNTYPHTYQKISHLFSWSAELSKVDFPLLTILRPNCKQDEYKHLKYYYFNSWKYIHQVCTIIATT